MRILAIRANTEPINYDDDKDILDINPIITIYFDSFNHRPRSKNFGVYKIGIDDNYNVFLQKGYMESMSGNGGARKEIFRQKAKEINISIEDKELLKKTFRNLQRFRHPVSNEMLFYRVYQRGFGIIYMSQDNSVEFTICSDEEDYWTLYNILINESDNAKQLSQKDK